MTKRQIKKIKTHLIHDLNAVAEQKTTAIMAVENCPDDTDFASQLAQSNLNITIHHRRVTRIHELEAALHRLSETDYGVCEECGEIINVARLKANPSARLCVLCQSAAENGLTRCA